jgi:hypothetical protein
MTALTVPAHFVGLDLPKSPETTELQVRDRLIRSQQTRAKCPSVGCCDDCDAHQPR